MCKELPAFGFPNSLKFSPVLVKGSRTQRLLGRFKHTVFLVAIKQNFVRKPSIPAVFPPVLIDSFDWHIRRDECCPRLGDIIIGRIMQSGDCHMGAAFLQQPSDWRHFSFVWESNLGPSLLCFGQWLTQMCLPLLPVDILYNWSGIS